MLGNTCKTAIKAVIYHASKEGTGEKLGVKGISRYIGTSGHTVSKILQNSCQQ